MLNFDEKEFGNNIRKARKTLGLSTYNLADAIGVSHTTISRFENGTLVPDARQIVLICNELKIHEYELFQDGSENIINKKESGNPFDTTTLYLYYNCYLPHKQTYKICRFRLLIKEKATSCYVQFMDDKTDHIYMTGHVQHDGNIAVFIFENYKPNNTRFEITQIILNISNNTNRPMIGQLSGTNGQYVPFSRKCVISPIDIPIDEDLKNMLKITESEKETLDKENILYLDTKTKLDFEN